MAQNDVIRRSRHELVAFLLQRVQNQDRIVDENVQSKQMRETMSLTMDNSHAVNRRLENLSDELDQIMQDVPVMPQLIRENINVRGAVMRIMETMQELLGREFLRDSTSADISVGDARIRGDDMRYIGQLFEAVGAVVIDEQNQVHLLLERSDDGTTGKPSAELAKAVDSINGELDAGRELVGERNIGCQISAPLTEEMIQAIHRSIRLLAPVDVRVEPITLRDPKHRGVA